VAAVSESRFLETGEVHQIQNIRGPWVLNKNVENTSRSVEGKRAPDVDRALKNEEMGGYGIFSLRWD